MKTILFTSIAAGIIALGAGFAAPAAMAQQKSAGPENLHYDIYEPSERRRMRRDTCGKDENESGAYCVKKCDKEYVAVANAKPPRCRSIEPLPPGRMPTAVRAQTGVQPLPPDTPPPANRPRSETPVPIERKPAVAPR